MTPDRWDDTLPVLRLTPAEFRALGEYSCTFPTGTTPGKRWKRLDGAYDRACSRPRWVIGEYDPDCPPDATRIRIIWYRPVITLRAAVTPVAPPAAAGEPRGRARSGTVNTGKAGGVWVQARDEALRQAWHDGASAAETLTIVNAIPADQPVASVQAIYKRASDLKLARSPEALAAVLQRSGRIGAQRAIELAATGQCHLGGPPLVWPTERQAIARRMWEAGDHADTILAAVNAMPGLPPVRNAQDVRQQASRRGWTRPDGFRSAVRARSAEALSARHAATATPPVASVPPAPPAPPSEAHTARPPAEEARIADAAVTAKQDKVRASLREMLAQKRSDNFMALSAIAQRNGLPLHEVMRLMGEVRAETKP